MHRALNAACRARFRWLLLRDPAGRAAPAALFSTDQAAPPEQAAWYPKREATFGDALAAVRRAPWGGRPPCTMSPMAPDDSHCPVPRWEHVSEAAAYAA